MWHPQDRTVPTNEQMLAVIEWTGNQFLAKADASYWPIEDQRRAVYFEKQLPHLRQMYRAAKAGDRLAVCCIFRQSFTKTFDCRRLEAAVSAWETEL